MALISLVIAVVSELVIVVVSAPLFGQTPSGWMAIPTAQANGARVQRPVKFLPFSRQSRLTLTVDTRWANNYGYRPIELTVTSPKPTTADHVITVRLRSGWAGTINAQKDFELPLGSTSATTSIAIPQYQSAGQFLWWDVWVDGIKDEDLSIDPVGASRTGVGGFGSAAGLSFLVAGPPSRARSLVAPSTFEFEVFSLPLAEFPKSWINYTCFDVVDMSWGDLQILLQTNSPAFAATERWVRAGGQLWVGEIGEEFEQLAELSKLFRLRASIAPAIRQRLGGPAERERDERSSQVGWQPARFRDGIREGQIMTFLDITTGISRVARNPEDILRLQNDPNFVVTQQQFEPVEEGPERRWARDSSEWFVEQRLGLGIVRAFRDASEISLLSQRPQSANPIVAANEESSERMPRSLATALRATERWNARHGMAPDDANRDFANLLVPGVGLAPVTEFRVLITLFVLLIGPVNYWLLKRWRRLHLLVLTVPLAAAIMTAALFAYATVSDGFGTTIRAHSLTTLDQRTGEAVCWARLSYYSGLAPGNGLTMPADVALYPINPAWNTSSIDANLGIKRNIVWDGDEVKLTRGWLRSRTPTQYLTIRSRKTPHRLELAAGGGKLRATNKLGTAVDFALIVDQAGKLWIGEKLPAGSVAFLKPIDRTEAIRRFRQLVIDNDPQPPSALSGEDSHYAVMQRRQGRQMFRARFGFQYSESRMTTSLANEVLAELAGLAGRPALALAPRSYVASTAAGPEVEHGLRGAKEEASFHVIVGQW
ncbi:MAG: hypothetical protein WD738_23820 [Pirellulales bacterium]